MSRYVDQTITWDPQHGDSHGDLLDRLIAFGRQLGRRSLIVCGGDEMAIFVARNRAVLEEYFVLPRVAADLVEQLVDKCTLDALCRRHGVATPQTIKIDTMQDLLAALDTLEPPLVVKSTAPSGARIVQNTLVVESRADLLELTSAWIEPFGAVIQEYIPDAASEDWFSHGYCGADATARVVFTGRKVRSWPTHGGATAAGFVAVNDELAALTTQFCAGIGYQGIFDLDWRRDLRTGTYYLLDFNPRVGAQFRMFETDAGIDVVRAMHLDLSGRPVPAGSATAGERFIVEPSDVHSLVVNRHHPQPWTGGVGRPRAAWLAGDDPLPVAAMLWYQGAISIKERLPGGR